jgi:hypothetical protein
MTDADTYRRTNLMADRDVIVTDSGSGSGLGMIVGIILGAIILLAVLYFSGAFGSVFGTRDTKIDVNIEQPSTPKT